MEDVEKLQGELRDALDGALGAVDPDQVSDDTLAELIGRVRAMRSLALGLEKADRAGARAAIVENLSALVGGLDA